MEKTIKVANIIEEARFGGPQNRITQVAEHLYHQGIDTTVVLPKADSTIFQEKLMQHQVKYKVLPLHRLTKEKRHLLKYVVFFFFEIWRLYRFLKHEKFDVIHVSGGSWQVKGAIAGKLVGAKVLWHLNDTRLPWFIKMVSKPIARFFADGFIVAGNRVKQYYLDGMGFSEERIFEIQAPVDCAKFDSEIVTPDSEMTASDKIRIVTVANINPGKGLEYFIHMAHVLNQKFSNLGFWIIGSVFTRQQKYYNTLKELVKQLNIQNIHFYGFCEDVRSLLKAANIYVFSSTAEASPIAVWEAMAMEKPIVSTDVGDVAKFIEDGTSGFVVPIKDAECLAQKVEEYLHNPEKAHRFGKLARKAAKEHLDLRVCVKRHKEAYKTILNMQNGVY